MTNNEAKSVLFNMLGKGIYVKDTKENQAILVALRALEQEPCENWYDVPSDEMTLEQARQAVRDLRKMWVEHLEQEPCEDAISRQAVLYGLASIAKAKAKSDAQKSLMGRVMFFTEHLPSVTPQPKTGHWIRWYEQKENDGCIEYIPHCKCSECGKEYDPHSSQFVKYCNECGAKMIEPQESEE